MSDEPELEAMLAGEITIQQFMARRLQAAIEREAAKEAAEREHEILNGTDEGTEVIGIMNAHPDDSHATRDRDGWTRFDKVARIEHGHPGSKRPSRPAATKARRKRERQARRKARS